MTDTVEHDLIASLVAIRNLAKIVDERWDELTSEQHREAMRATAQQAEALLDVVRDLTRRDSN
jgi:hypothetical protein